MQIFMTTIIRMTLLGSALILFLFIIKRIFVDKIDSRIISVVWIMIAVRLLMPFMVNSPINIGDIFPNEPNESSIITETDNVLFENQIPVEQNNIETGQNPIVFDTENIAINQTQAEVSQKQTLVSRIKSISIYMYLFWMYIIGAVLVLLISLLKYCQFSIRVSRYKDIKSLYRVLFEIKSKLWITSDIRIISCPLVDTPVTFGFFKPKILLPHGFEKSLSPDKIKLVLTHELLHIKRKDILKNYIWLLVKTAHWFNPLVWLAYNEYTFDIEKSVDYIIIKRSTEKQGYLYIQSIIDTLRLSNSKKNIPLALSFLDGKNKLKKRVENMMNPNKKSKLVGVLTVLLIMIAMVGCFTTACSFATNSETETTSAKEIDIKSPEKAEEKRESKNIYVTNSVDYPSKYTDTVQIADGKVTFDIDAEIIVNKDSKYSIADIKPYFVPEEQFNKAAMQIFGTLNIEDANTELTKSQMQEIIDDMPYEIKKARNDGDEERAQEFEETLKDLTERIKTAPEVPQTTKYNGEYKVYNHDDGRKEYSIELRKDATEKFSPVLSYHKSIDSTVFNNFGGELLYENNFSELQQNEEEELYESLDVEFINLEGASTEDFDFSQYEGLEDIIEKANGLIEDIEIKDRKISSINIAINPTGDYSNIIIEYEKIFKGVDVLSSAQQGGYYPRNIGDDRENYIDAFNSEWLRIAYLNGELNEFVWSNIYEFDETVEEDFKLLDFEDITDNMQLYLSERFKISENEDGLLHENKSWGIIVSKDAFIDKAVLTYAVEPKEGSKYDFQLTPCWAFYGGFDYGDGVETESGNVLEGRLSQRFSLLTVNAVTGEILNSQYQ